MDYKKFIDLETSFLAAVTLFFFTIFIKTFQMEPTGTQLLPRFLGVFGVITTLVLLAAKYHKIMKSGEQGKEVKRRGKGFAALYTAASVAIYFVTIRFLGFILATFIAVWGFTFMMRYKNKVAVALLSIGLPLALHLLFVSLLKVRLPQGLFESLLPF